MKPLARAGLLVCVLLLACDGALEAERAAALVGTWRSDKAATLAEIDVIGGFDSRVRGTLEKTLGQRTLSYDGERMTTRLAGVTRSSPYRVIEVRGPSGREIVVESHDHELGSVQQQVLVVEGDRLWFWRDGGRWREFYRRVSAVATAGPGSGR